MNKEKHRLINCNKAEGKIIKIVLVRVLLLDHKFKAIFSHRKALLFVKVKMETVIITIQLCCFYKMQMEQIHSLVIKSMWLLRHASKLQKKIPILPVTSFFNQLVILNKQNNLEVDKMLRLLFLLLLWQQDHNQLLIIITMELLIIIRAKIHLCRSNLLLIDCWLVLIILNNRAIFNLRLLLLKKSLFILYQIPPHDNFTATYSKFTIYYTQLALVN